MTGQELRKYREKKLNLTRKEFSKISFIPVATLRSWESEQRSLKPMHIFFLKLLKEHLDKKLKLKDKE